MRLLSSLDWRNFFERISLIDTLLKSDPADVYDKMNFLTRDRYREVIERIAKRTDTDELKVGSSVVELARQAAKGDGGDFRRSHIGFYLIAEGFAELEQIFGYKGRLSESLKRFVFKHPTTIYLGGLTFLTGLIVGLFIGAALFYGASGWLAVAFALISIIPASDLAISTVNWTITLLIPPRLLPQMDTSPGIPETARTIVVVPTLLLNKAEVDDHIEKLE